MEPYLTWQQGDKPRLRGVLHEWAFYVSVPLGIALGLVAGSTGQQISAAVFAGTVVAMFGVSALYHRFTWSSRTRAWLRRLDHAGIFGLIAGTYTPFGILLLDGAWQIVILAVIWGGALFAIVTKVAWVTAPKWLSAVAGVTLGWVGIMVLPQIIDGTGIGGTSLTLVGGACYTLGAVVYARRRPDPFPATFGYHELFHALVIAAVSVHYAAVAFFVVT